MAKTFMPAQKADAPRPAGWRATSHRRRGSCGAASGTRRSAPRSTRAPRAASERRRSQFGERRDQVQSWEDNATQTASAPRRLPPARRTPRTSGARFSMFSAVSTSAVAPQATGSRASSSASGKFAFTTSRSCSRGQHGALFGVPAPHQLQQVGAGLGVDGVERLVEHDHAGVLQQQPREQHALHLPAGQRADRGAVRSRSGRPRRWRLRLRRDPCGRCRRTGLCRATGPSPPCRRH